MRLTAVFFAFSSLARPILAGDWSWRQSITPHFEISHQGAWLPTGFELSLERIHSRLRLDLAMFSPWMSNERIKLHLYRDAKSYGEGEFHPPPWSNGIAIYRQRTVAVPDQGNTNKLLQVISHETTHLIFESYWGESGKSPPSWLNEGLAMMEEAQAPDHPESSDWYREMIYVLPGRATPLEDFVEISPTQDLRNDKTAVELWYVESYSLVTFLFRTHSRLQFKSFCSDLRDGKSFQESLWLVYRYNSIEQFENAWKAWLKEPIHRRRLARTGAALRKNSDESFDRAGDFQFKLLDRN